MGYSYLLDSPGSLAIFRQKFDIPGDVEVAYCHESEITLHKRQGTAFFPLMAVLEDRVRFPVDPLMVSTLRYYGLCPDQLPPNFYWVVNCVSRLISCMPDSNRNSTREFVQVRGNWCTEEIPCPLLRREMGSYRSLNLEIFVTELALSSRLLISRFALLQRVNCSPWT